MKPAMSFEESLDRLARVVPEFVDAVRRHDASRGERISNEP